jgi:hypothetical protein
VKKKRRNRKTNKSRDQSSWTAALRKKQKQRTKDSTFQIWVSLAPLPGAVFEVVVESGKKAETRHMFTSLSSRFTAERPKDASTSSKLALLCYASFPNGTLLARLLDLVVPLLKNITRIGPLCLLFVYASYILILFPPNKVSLALAFHRECLIIAPTKRSLSLARSTTY